MLIFLQKPELTFADTIFLQDGTVLTGKVVKTEADVIQLKNAYGLFTIKEKQIQKKYITNDYKEDVLITKKMGLKIKEEDIRKNYEAGSEVQWGSRLSVSGSLNYTFGRLNTVLPYGYTVTAAYDRGLDFLFTNERRWYLPGVRFEAGYVSFQNDDVLINGFSGNGGLMWMARPFEGHNGSIVFGVMPGVSYLNVEKKSDSVTSTKLSIHSLAGYEYAFSSVILLIHGRYLFVYDKEVSLQSFGLAFGIGYRL